MFLSISAKMLQSSQKSLVLLFVAYFSEETHFFPGEPPPELFWFEEAGSQKLRGPTANFCDPASSNKNNSGRGGGFTGGKKSIHTITAKSFSNPHTEFEARRSRRLGIKLAAN